MTNPISKYELVKLGYRRGYVYEGYYKGTLKLHRKEKLPIKLRLPAYCTPSQSWNQHLAKHG